LPNVHLLGWRPYEELPACCKGFDVALLPFKIDELTLAANPLKLREYLAAGLPVVSSALPEVERLRPLVRIAADTEGFVRAIEEILAGGEAGLSALRSEAMRGESWDRRTEEMSEIADRYLAFAEVRRSTLARRAVGAHLGARGAT
jgi:glycosyltransferase involved in cell wall biosynthesis